ncbi:MAG: tetratricopeptide repeat protein [Candidatus Brocadiales bacterium]
MKNLGRTILIILLLFNATYMVIGCSGESSISKLKEQLEVEKKKREVESKKNVKVLNRLYKETRRVEKQKKLVADLRNELETIKAKNPEPEPQDLSPKPKEDDNFHDISETQQKGIEKLIQLAGGFYWDGDYAVAKEIYDVVVELGNTDANTLFRMARCYGVTPETDKAISLYQKVIESLEHDDASNPLYFQAYNNLGGVYKRKGMYKKAELAYVKAIEINEVYTNAYYNLGLLYEENLDDELGAIACYERYIEFDGEMSVYIKKKLDEIKDRD